MRKERGKEMRRRGKQDRGGRAKRSGGKRNCRKKETDAILVH